MTFKYGLIGTAYFETLAEVEQHLLWHQKHKTEAVAMDDKNRIVGRVILETDNQFRMWMEPIV